VTLATTSSGEHRVAPVGLPPVLAVHPRYQISGELGRGGMGVVYGAIDRETGERVAIKVLSSRRDGLLRFKNEFRLASRLSHPNLVALYDLVISDEIAYFVMEHAPGVDLRKYVRGGKRGADLLRLFHCASQMLDALDCLGAAGVVHRDLKPSNVIVSDDGNVKLLDFGLAGTERTPDFAAAMLAGTPTYMSPEQIDGRPLTPASDLYSLGVILYEMIAGEPPFIGPARTVLNAHRHQYPLPLSDRVEGVPEELELFCLRLLAKRPGERFADARTAREALERCGGPASISGNHRAHDRTWGELGSGQFAALGDSELVGRDSERALLEALLDRVREQSCQMALISGDSGIGKTALAEAILSYAQELGCVVLRGACREHEAVPYNAFDAVVDGAAATVERLIAKGALNDAELKDASEDFALLGKLFPVLRELLPADAPPAGGAPDPGARERAFMVCKRLVERVTRSRPIVILLDDLHWADEDSLSLLSHLLAPPGSKGLFVIASAWPLDASDDTPFSRFLRQQQASPDGLLSHIVLGPVGDLEGAEIVDATASHPVSADASLCIQNESAGNPFLLVELTRLHVEESVPRPTVSEVARRRLSLLDDDERALVELAALAPGAVDTELLHASQAAGSRPLALDGAGLKRLVGLKILRESGVRGSSRGQVRYDFYHNRIRETIRDQIPPERQRAIHLRLADTLLALRPGDPETLVRELLLAGDELRAARFAEAAAETAVARLAHARAVELYELAVKHAAPSDARRLRVRLGQALEGSARFAEAAGHFVVGLEGNHLQGLDRTGVQLRLANCLLHKGELEASGELVEKSLEELGYKKKPRLLAILSVLWLLLRVVLARGKTLRKSDDRRTEALLSAFSLAVPHFQFTSRNLEQLEFALRYRLLGMASPSAEVRQEAHAMALVMLLPFAHLGGRIGRRVAAHMARLEAGHARMATERGRAWLPLLRAVYAMVAGRPDRAIVEFSVLQDFAFARTGYVALQRHNALILAGAYDQYVQDLAQVAHHEGSLKPLDVARLAYIERVHGHDETARRLCDDIRKIDPESLPWTHRSLFTYQLAELQLLDGNTAEAARLARSLLPRIRKSAIAPTTGAFESADAVARAFLAEARRLHESDEPQDKLNARKLVEEASRAIESTPFIEPPLFAARLRHDRGIVALALGDLATGYALLEEAEKLSRAGHIPCFRMRLIEDLLEVLPEHDARRPQLAEEAKHFAALHRYARRRRPAPWLFPLGR
jgi:serine/threonine protein kinase